MRKTALAIVFLAAMFAHTAHAQHFDWVKSYTGTDRPGHVDNWIAGSVTDSDGNLYILGQCAANAQFEGESLVPIGSFNGNCILIAKISTDGELLWHKVINPTNSATQCIRMIGDSNIVCMVNITFSGPIYYLDTLLSNPRSDLMLSDSLSSPHVAAFITLDLDGNLKSNHFFNLAYIDSNNRLVTTDRLSGNPADSTTIYPVGLCINGSFDIDKEGNIIVVRRAKDETLDFVNGEHTNISIENGLLSGIQIWRDGHYWKTIYPQNQPKKWNLMLLKFSPDFEDLTAWKYVFAGERGTNLIEANINIICDSQNEIYLSGCAESPSWDTTTCSASVSNSNLFFHRTNLSNSFVIKFNQTLSPLWIQQFAKRHDNDAISAEDIIFCSFAIDENEDYIYVSGCTSGLDADRPIISNGGDSIWAFRTAYHIKLRSQNGEFAGCGIVNFKASVDLRYISWRHQMVVDNHRVFVPLVYRDSIIVGDETLLVEDGKYANGVYIWDTSGHDVGFVDIKSNSNQAQPGNIISLHDSILYICGLLLSNGAWFDDIYLPYYSNSTAYVSKYVDTSFSFPYHAPSNTRILNIERDDIHVYPNPVSSTLHLDIPQGESIKECHVISATGLRHRGQLSGNTLNLEKYPAGIHYIEIITNKNIYTQKIIKL